MRRVPGFVDLCVALAFACAALGPSAVRAAKIVVHVLPAESREAETAALAFAMARALRADGALSPVTVEQLQGSHTLRQATELRAAAEASLGQARQTLASRDLAGASRHLAAALQALEALAAHATYDEIQSYADVSFFLASLYQMQSKPKLAVRQLARALSVAPGFAPPTSATTGPLKDRLEQARKQLASAGTGYLRVRVTQGDALLWIDGELRGPARELVSGLGAGSHFVRVERSGFASWGKLVEIEADAESQEQVTLQPLERERELDGQARSLLEPSQHRDVAHETAKHLAGLATGADRVVIVALGTRPDGARDVRVAVAGVRAGTALTRFSVPVEGDLAMAETATQVAKEVSSRTAPPELHLGVARLELPTELEGERTKLTEALAASLRSIGAQLDVVERLTPACTREPECVVDTVDELPSALEAVLAVGVRPESSAHHLEARVLDPTTGHEHTRLDESLEAAEWSVDGRPRRALAARLVSAAWEGAAQSGALDDRLRAAVTPSGDAINVSPAVGWTLIGGGALLGLAGGLIAALQVQTLQDDAVLREDRDAARTRGLAGLALGIGGAVLAGLGVVLSADTAD